MIEELVWDTAFFGRRIGRIGRFSSEKALSGAVAEVEEEGFEYLFCKLGGGDFRRMRILERDGFYLSDIGVTWEINTQTFTGAAGPFEPGGLGAKPQDLKGSLRALRPSAGAKGVEPPGEKDIASLRKMTKGLFTDSRFYHDPFFTRREADRLFGAWVENSVRGLVADRVFWIRGAGFITCRKSSAATGELPLVGVVKAMRGKGVGRRLVIAALAWLEEAGIKKARTRTQMINLEGMNFYARMGFRAADVDVVMSRILRPSA